jgi:hypothetical protein
MDKICNGEPSRRWENNIRICIEKYGGRCGLNSSGTG